MTDRPDSEHAQIAIRIVIVLLFLVYLLGIASTTMTHPAIVRSALTYLFIEGLTGVALLAWLLARPGVSHPRRFVGMASDYVAMAAIMALAGETVAPLYVVCMWVTIGNGLRYGPKYLQGAVCMACVSFAWVILTTHFWLEHVALSWGLLGGLAAIPLYLASLLRALTKATNEARRANEAKSRFLANMSHELRTPLNGVVGMAEVLATTSLSAEQRECSDVIQTSARTLLTIVEDVLDISAIEVGKLHCTTSDFRAEEMLRAIQLMLQPAASVKKLELRFDIEEGVPRILHGDADHLRQILVNLISNAIKFTSEGSVVASVSRLHATDSRSALLRFSVRDTGIGIPKQAQEKIFQAFEQADTSHRRRFGGTGLGTTIARSLAELLGGSIAFESVEGQGSHFWADIPFEIPASKPIELVDAPRQSENVIAFADPFIRHRARTRSLRILIADDQPANITVLNRLLGKAGHITDCVADGEEVLNKIEDKRFDCVIIDLHMPGLSGLDVLKQARVMEAGGSRTPFVILSADATPETVRQCEHAGARAFMTKPLILERLLDVLAEVASGEDAPAPVKRVAEVTEIRPSQRTASLAAEDDVISDQVLTELSELKLGDDFVGLFVEECLRDAGKAIAELDRVGAQNQWDLFRDHCHALKGVAGNMGATRLAKSASDAMKLGNWELPKEWSRRVSQLRQQLELARSALRQRSISAGAMASREPDKI